MPRMPDQPVLVVDPSTALIEMVAQLLTSAGLTVVSCRSFEESHAYLEANTPLAIVSGVRLGAFNGLHLAALATQRTPGLKAVVYAGSEDAGLRSEALACGAIFLERERLANDLLTLLCPALDGGPGASPSNRLSPGSADARFTAAIVASH
jgi:DNA-binding NtrC family response regulator